MSREDITAFFFKSVSSFFFYPIFYFYMENDYL